MMRVVGTVRLAHFGAVRVTAEEPRASGERQRMYRVESAEDGRFIGVYTARIIRTWPLDTNGRANEPEL